MEIRWSLSHLLILLAQLRKTSQTNNNIKQIDANVYMLHNIINKPYNNRNKMVPFCGAVYYAAQGGSTVTLESVDENLT